MLSRNRLRWAACYALMTSAIAVSGISIAQVQSADVTDEKPLEEIIVTGSHIKRFDAETALPVQIITKEEIRRTGATTVEQLLQTVTMAVQGNNNVVTARGASATTSGIATVSLRGMGSPITLVLINGRRVAGGGAIADSISVDINSIPLAAIERIEVLKDGASAIYGSDAIAGVINFVLRQDYQGAEISATGGGTSDGGATYKQLTSTLGTGDLNIDRYNALLIANYQKEDALYGAQRDFAKVGYNVAAQNDETSLYTFPANIFPLDGSFGLVNPLAPNGCAPSFVNPLSSFPNSCSYDPSPVLALLPESERASLYGTLHIKLSDTAELYAEASYNRNKTRFIIQPTPVGIILHPDSPYYPTAYVQSLTTGAPPDLFVLYRSVVTGNRDLTDISSQPRGVLGLKGSVAGWDYDVSALYTKTSLTEQLNNGYPSESGLMGIFDTGEVNFFGPNTAAEQAKIDATQFHGNAYSTATSLTSVAGNVSRELAKLSAGSLAVAFGMEARKETFSTDPNPIIQTGDILGYSGNFQTLNKSRNVFAVYGELNVPLLSSLESDLAIRHDHYQIAGSKTTPKVSLRWKPLDQLLVRTSFGKGFRAPSLTELYFPQISGLTSSGLSDPARCGQADSNNVVHNDVADCNTQFATLFGGTTTLKSEESDNFTFGVVLAPLENISLALDLFSIKETNTITPGVSASAILEPNSKFSSLITRSPPDPASPGLPGHITQINELYLNFGETRMRGIDLDLRANWPIAGLGKLTAQLTGTYFDNYEIQNPDGSFTSHAGKVTIISSGGVFPRWHHYLTLGWNNGPWEASIAHNFQSHYQDLPGTNEDTTVANFKPRTVGSYLTWDTQASYSGIKHVRLTLGIKNVFNRDPPYTNAGGGNYFQAGYDPGYADPRGRYIYGTITYTF